MIVQFVRMLSHIKTRDKLPKIPRQLANNLNRQVDEEQSLVLMASLARDEQGVNLLMKKYEVETASDLLKAIPRPKPKADMKRRFRNWLARLEGGTVSDPVAIYVREYNRRRRR